MVQLVHVACQSKVCEMQLFSMVDKRGEGESREGGRGLFLLLLSVKISLSPTFSLLSLWLLLLKLTVSTLY